MLQTTDEPVLWTRSSSHGPSQFAHYRSVAEVAPFVRTGPPQRLPPLDTFFPWQWKTLRCKMPLLWGTSGLRMPVSALLCGPGYLAQRKGWWPRAWASMKYRVIVSIQELPPSARDNPQHVISLWYRQQCNMGSIKSIWPCHICLVPKSDYLTITSLMPLNTCSGTVTRRVLASESFQAEVAGQCEPTLRCF